MKYFCMSWISRTEREASRAHSTLASGSSSRVGIEYGEMAGMAMRRRPSGLGAQRWSRTCAAIDTAATEHRLP